MVFFIACENVPQFLTTSPGDAVIPVGIFLENGAPLALKFARLGRTAVGFIHIPGKLTHTPLLGYKKDAEFGAVLIDPDTAVVGRQTSVGRWQGDDESSNIDEAEGLNQSKNRMV